MINIVFVQSELSSKIHNFFSSISGDDHFSHFVDLKMTSQFLGAHVTYRTVMSFSDDKKKVAKWPPPETDKNGFTHFRSSSHAVTIMR